MCFCLSDPAGSSGRTIPFEASYDYGYQEGTDYFTFNEFNECNSVVAFDKINNCPMYCVRYGEKSVLSLLELLCALLPRSSTSFSFDRLLKYKLYGYGKTLYHDGSSYDESTQFQKNILHHNET